MPVIQSFKAFRPRPDLAEEVSARSSGSEGPSEIGEFLKKHPQSYLNVVKPHLLVGDTERIPEKHYPVAVEYLQKIIKEGWLQQDQASSVYLYEQTKLKENQVFTGLICLVSVEDYLQGRIKKHENTRTVKEQALASHVGHVKAIGEPVLLTHQPLKELDEIYSSVKSGKPDYDFETEGTLRHRLWVLSDAANIETIREHFSKLEAFYIADGHHRSAGAGRFGLDQREANPGYSGEEDFNYFLACLIPADKLQIVAFHRLVDDLHGLSKQDFLSHLEDDFEVKEADEKAFSPSEPHSFGLYIEGQWYLLKLRKEKIQGDVLEKLDVSLIETYILKKHLGIADSKTHHGIAFLEGTKGLAALTSKVDSGEYKAAFTLYPTQVSEVIEVADKGLVMPPKSTWIEPKLRTGLIVQKFQ